MWRGAKRLWFTDWIGRWFERAQKRESERSPESVGPVAIDWNSLPIRFCPFLPWGLGCLAPRIRYQVRYHGAKPPSPLSGVTLPCYLPCTWRDHGRGKSSASRKCTSDRECTSNGDNDRTRNRTCDDSTTGSRSRT